MEAKRGVAGGKALNPEGLVKDEDFRRGVGVGLELLFEVVEFGSWQFVMASGVGDDEKGVAVLEGVVGVEAGVADKSLARKFVPDVVVTPSACSTISGPTVRSPCICSSVAARAR